jgi:hypothetical protein
VKVPRFLKKLRGSESGDGEQPVDNADVATADVGATALVPGPEMAPVNWVPSQQDERPRH